MALTYSGYFGYAGGGKNGALVDVWASSRFASPPAQDQAPPSGDSDGGPVVSGVNFGGPGAFIVEVPSIQDYYCRIQYGGHSYWSAVSLADIQGESTSGVGVLTFNGRGGTVVLTTADVTGTGVTYSDVDADQSGAASAALSSAESYTDTEVTTERERAQTAEAACLQAGNNLSDVASVTTALDNLGLTDSGWVNVEGGVGFQNSWGQAVEAVAYRKQANIVRLRGALLPPSGWTSPTAAFTLPTGYRPAVKSVQRVTPISNSADFWYVVINTDGTVLPQTGPAGVDQYLDGITFTVD